MIVLHFPCVQAFGIVRIMRSTTKRSHSQRNEERKKNRRPATMIWWRKFWLRPRQMHNYNFHLLLVAAYQHVIIFKIIINIWRLFSHTNRAHFEWSWIVALNVSFVGNSVNQMDFIYMCHCNSPLHVAKRSSILTYIMCDTLLHTELHRQKHRKTKKS